MRNVLAFLAAAVLLFAALGWWRSWFAVTGVPADAGRVAFRIEFDAMKVGGDVLELLRGVQRYAAQEKPKPD